MKGPVTGRAVSEKRHRYLLALAYFGAKGNSYRDRNSCCYQAARSVHPAIFEKQVHAAPAPPAAATGFAA